MTVDLPTPPLPDVTAMIAAVLGQRHARRAVATIALQLGAKRLALGLVHRAELQLDALDAGQAPDRVVHLRAEAPLSGQPGVVSSSCTRTTPSSSHAADLIMPSVTTSCRSFGILHAAQLGEQGVTIWASCHAVIVSRGAP